MAPDLFRGMRFWLSFQVPQRNRFLELIREHGGHVVLSEKDADVKLVDHKKRPAPPGSYSYQFVERSIRRGQLEDLETHRVAPKIRSVGDTTVATSNQRRPFTLEEDQRLWDYVQSRVKAGAKANGNEIYKKFWDIGNREHPWQSWRDRYVKHLQGRPRPGGSPAHSDVRNSRDFDTRSAPATHGESRPAYSERTTSPRSVSSSRPEATRSKSTSTRLSHEQTEDRVMSPEDNHLKRKRYADEDVPDSLDTPVSEARSAKRRAIDVQKPMQPSPTRLRSTFQDQSKSKDASTEPVESETAPEFQASQSESIKQKQKQTDSEAHTATSNGIDEGDWSFLTDFPPLPDVETESPSRADGGMDQSEWITHQLRTGRARNPGEAIKALKATSMDTRLANLVLRSIVAGKGIPRDIPGVWTDDDDFALESENSRLIERVLKKHGTKHYAKRFEYLSALREAEEATGLVL